MGQRQETRALIAAALVVAGVLLVSLPASSNLASQGLDSHSTLSHVASVEPLQTPSATVNNSEEYELESGEPKEDLAKSATIPKEENVMDDPYGLELEKLKLDNETKLCNSWCPQQYLDLVDCERVGMARLKTAFQIENCEAAMTPANLPEVAKKIEKVASMGPFVFFRGAAAFFDYNMMCADTSFTLKKVTMPRVFSNGDCHPENFGVMVQSSNNVEKKRTTGDLVWGVNDFDQSFSTPFSWDLKRGATGFALGTHGRNWPQEYTANASQVFIESYLDTIMSHKNCEYLNTERFLEGSEYVATKAPLIEKLFKKARKREKSDRAKQWLEKKMSIDLKNSTFLPNKERGIEPLPASSIPAFQASIDAWLYHGVAALAKYPNVSEFYKVLAVARKVGSGTGSIGLNRFYVLIKGRYLEPHGYIILEMKQEVNSVLEVFFRYSYTKSQEGKRAVNSVRNAWPYANLFFGWTTYNGDSYVVREKSKHAVSVDLEDLTEEEYLDYSKLGGRALAFYHVRARCPNYKCELEDKSAVDGEICSSIQNYLTDHGLEAFKASVFEFARKEYTRQVAAYELIKEFVKQSSLENTPVTNLLRGGKRPTDCRAY